MDLAINDPFIRQTTFNLDTDPSSQFFWQSFDLARPTALAPPSPLLVFSVRHQLARGHGSPVELQHPAVGGFRHGPASGLCRQPRSAAALGDPSQSAGSGAGSDSARGGPTRIWARSTGLGSRRRFQLSRPADPGRKALLATACSSSAATRSRKCISNSDSTFVGEGTSIQNGRDFRQQRGLCTQHFSQRFTLSWLYDLPFGRGKRCWDRRRVRSI